MHILFEWIDTIPIQYRSLAQGRLTAIPSNYWSNICPRSICKVAHTIHRDISPLTSHPCALPECIIMNELKIYSANQPNNKELVHSTFLSLIPASSKVTPIWFIVSHHPPTSSRNIRFPNILPHYSLLRNSFTNYTWRETTRVRCLLHTTFSVVYWVSGPVRFTLVRRSACWARR